MASKPNRARDLAEEKAIRDAASKKDDTASLLESGQKSSGAALPPNYDPETALELLMYAAGLAYDTTAGRSYKPFIVHPDGGCMYKLEDGVLTVVCRGTLLLRINEALTNVFGFGVPVDTLFDGKEGVQCFGTGGILAYLGPAPRIHRGYALRAMRYLQWLNESLGEHYALSATKSAQVPQGYFNWNTQIKKIRVTGHSLGGSLSLIFACTVKTWNARLLALREGESILLNNMRITRLADEKCRVEQSPGLDSPFDENNKQELVVPLSVNMVNPDVEVDCYVFSATKPGNYGLKTIHDEFMPNTFNHQMAYDIAAPLIFPWWWRPGYNIDFYVTESGFSTWQGAVKGRLHSAWRWVLARSGLLNLIVFGADYHGPSPILFACMVKHLRDLGASTCWSKLSPLVIVDDFIDPGNWLRAGSKDDLSKESVQNRLLASGLELQSSDFTVRVGDRTRDSTNVLFCLLFLLGISLRLLVLSSVLTLVAGLVLTLLALHVLRVQVTDHVARFFRYTPVQVRPVK